MTPWRQFSVLMASVLLLSGCGTLFSGDGSEAPTPPSAPAESPVAGDLARFYEQEVAWKNCGSADCATITVPLDYADPDGPTVELAAARVKARGERIGTLFVNPGGPGGSAVDYAKAADYIATDAIRESYDIVGVDPRGVAGSEPVRCLTDQQVDDLMAADGTPDSPAEEQAIISDSAMLGEQCGASGNELIAHMGTVDSARDLDIARAVVGDPVLNYLGKSYGTMLGATYAELFPDRVGRMVLDGALPASLDLVQVTKEQGEAFEVAFRDFVEDCLTADDCPLQGTVDEGVQQLRDWIMSLDADPIPSGDRDLNEPLASYAILSYLYFPSYDYDVLRPALAAAMNQRDAKPLLALLDERISRAPDGRFLDNSTDAFYGVTCLDRPFTGTLEDVKRYEKEWAVTAPTFGPALAWGLLPCKDWPASAEPITMTTAAGSNPILVVSTTNDPATPYQWGVTLADELENATLLTYDGFGHTAYFEQSSCIDEAVDAYLLQGTMPADGVLCQ